MWHASAAPVPGLLSVRATLQEGAYKALEGVGDAALGEWTEWTGYAFHVRRRLTAHEAAYVDPVADIRGTPEARARLAAVAAYLPTGWSE